MHPASSEQTQEHLATSPKRPRKDRKKLANVAFKTAFVPTYVEQVRKLEQGFGTARFAYNWALDAWEARRTSKTANSFIKLRNQLNSVKSSEFPWMAEVPKDIPAEAIRDLTTAFKNFFDKKLKARYPQRKKKGRARFAFRLPADRLRWREVSGDDGAPLSEVYLSSIGWVALREEFQPIGKVVYATVSRKADRYFVSFCMEYEPVKHVRQVRKPKSVGIDLGLKHTLALSSGVKLASPRSLAQQQVPLARLNRQLHRRIKGSRNRGKAAKRLAKLHARVANIRRDFTEKTTTNLLRRYDIVAVEDLNVAALLKTGRYGRSLSDSALGSIVQALHRKAAKYGCHVQEVDRFFPSSKQCRKCQAKNHDLTLADRLFYCAAADCRLVEDRDVHAARNIQQEVLRKLPGAAGKSTPVESWSLPPRPQGQSGKSARRSRKQRPRGAATSNAGQRQKPIKPAQLAEQV